VPLTRARKEEQVAQYKELLDASTGFAIVSTNGLSVTRIQSLRRKLRDIGGEYRVGKNTLVIKALEQSGWKVPTDILQGQTAVVFGKDNFPGVAKALLGWIETEKIEEANLKVVGGVMGNSILTGGGVTDVSNLPTLPELQAQLIGLIAAPATNLVSVLQAATGGVVNFMQALEDKLNEGAA
jgi:large subunit ribosomal protein L10